MCFTVTCWLLTHLFSRGRGLCNARGLRVSGRGADQIRDPATGQPGSAEQDRLSAHAPSRTTSTPCAPVPCQFQLSGRNLDSRTFAANAVRLQLHALAYNLGNFLRTLATPEPIKDWSLTSLKDKLIKIGAKVVSHGRYVIFQMAEVAIARQVFQEILRLIAELRPQPPPALA